jgi:3-deoxy-manno-octulosonate cytidylyltransferase (CMP-KDO synthetase)
LVIGYWLLKQMKIIGVIPSRYAAQRFPGKPLALIAGKPLVQHVVEHCKAAKLLSDVIVATEDQRIYDAVNSYCHVEMTSPEHPSGTDRVAEVVRRNPCDAAINIQGDEPLMQPEVIDAVAKALANARMSTAATLLRNPAEYEDPNVVKVVVNLVDRALYFSRRTIPFLREAANRPIAEQLAAFPFLKHLGIYGYRRDVLLELVHYPVSALEAAEKLEQLRALENGIEIAVARVEYNGAAVDVPADVARVEALIKTQK